MTPTSRARHWQSRLVVFAKTTAAPNTAFLGALSPFIRTDRQDTTPGRLQFPWDHLE